MTSLRWPVAVVVLLSTWAHAQDAGFEWLPGVRIGPVTTIFAGTPYLVDDQQRIVVGTRTSVSCIDAQHNVLQTVDALFNETLGPVFVDAARSELWLLSSVATVSDGHLRFTRFSCANGREAPTVDLPSVPLSQLVELWPTFPPWVMAPGVLEFASPSGIWRVDTSSMSPAATLVISSQAVAAALGEGDPLPNATATVRACAAAALGARTCSVGTLAGQSTVSIDPTGLAVRRLSEWVTRTSAIMGSWLVPDATLQGTLVMPWGRYAFAKADRPLLGFVGSGAQFFALRVARDGNTAVGGGINRLIPGPVGSPYLVIDIHHPNGNWYPSLARLLIDQASLDLDQDLLSRSEEDALGTSDGDDDTDDDGVNDGVERAWFLTDPTDAGSHPPPPEKAWRWGLSPLVALGFHSPPRPGGPLVACPAHDPGPCAPCREANGSIRQATGSCLETAAKAFATTRDESATFIGVRETPTSPQFIALQRLSRDPVLFPSSVPISGGDPVFAVDEDTVYQLGRLASGTRLVRFTPAGSEELSLQTGCPLARLEPGCEERLRLGPISQVELIETLGERRALLAHVTARFGEALVALDEKGYHFLLDLSDVGLLNLRWGSGPGRSEFFLAGSANEDQRVGETWRVTSTFRRADLSLADVQVSIGPTRPWSPSQVPPDGGAGYPAGYQEVWWTDPLPGSANGCVSVGDVTVCDATAFPSTPVPDQFVYDHLFELRPTPPRLERGDVLLAQPGGLWKMDHFGTLAPWVTTAELTALVDDADTAARLATDPFQRFTAMSVAPSGLAVCLVESREGMGGVGRTWALTLDATTRRPNRLRQVPGRSPGACAWDEQDVLHVANDEALLREGVKVGDGFSGVQGLARLGGRWVTWGVGRPVYCLDAGGSWSNLSGWDAVAVSALGDGVAWVDLQGRAFAGTVDELCDRLKVPRERLSDDDQLTFHEVLSNDVWLPVSRRRIRFGVKFENGNQWKTVAALAMRPDGTGLFGAWNRYVDELGFNTPLKGPDFTFVFAPSLHPKDFTKRWPMFDRYRRDAFHWGLAGPEAGAMAVVPGGEPAGEWGRYGEPTGWVPDGGWPAAPPETDGGAGGGNGGGGGGTEQPPGCACAQVDPGALLGVALLGLVGRRRARPRRAR